MKVSKQAVKAEVVSCHATKHTHMQQLMAMKLCTNKNTHTLNTASLLFNHKFIKYLEIQLIHRIFAYHEITSARAQSLWYPSSVDSSANTVEGSHCPQPNDVT